MASVVRYQAAAATTTGMACEEEFMPQGLISCFGRSLSRASSGRHLEYCRDVSSGGAGGEESRRMAQERSARAKLRWKAVAQEIMARRSGGGGGGGGGGGSGRRRKTAFSYDSKSYALNFDDQAGAE
uniref:Uncharacterized protein n=1 Tax=Oryza punctata TaxID=4537 RepID=A0A0E0LMH5_ORYPU